MPSMWAAIHKKTGIYPRVLADRFFFKLPIVNQGMTWIFQGLLASRPVADIAFKRNYNLLVYPGKFFNAP